MSINLHLYHIYIHQYLSKWKQQGTSFGQLARWEKKPFVFEGFFQHFPVKIGHQEIGIASLRD